MAIVDSINFSLWLADPGYTVLIWSYTALGSQIVMAQQPRLASGKFGSPYKEPRGDAIAMRLPASLDKLVREEADRHETRPNCIIEKILAEHYRSDRQDDEAS